MTDWNIALGVKPIQVDFATPLMRAAQLHNQEMEAQQSQQKMRMSQMNAEARGLAPFVDKPEFAQRWAESADRMLQNGLIDPQTHQQWRTNPSPLMLKQMLAQSESPEMSFRREEAERTQKNTDREFTANQGYRGAQLAIARQNADNATDYTPEERTAHLEKLKIDPSSPQGQAYILNGTLPGAGTNEYGLNLLYGEDKDGKPVAMQPSKGGGVRPVQMPDGVSLRKDPIRIDTATGTQLLDPITRQPVGFVPKDLAGAAVAKELGDNTAAGIIDLPKAESNAKIVTKIIDDLSTHPGKAYSLGIGSKVPTIPGTPQADFRAGLEQLQGQTFLQAYQVLRGGGAITDIEGRKGENAIARMQTAQSQKAFDAALNEFKDIVAQGLENARKKAKGPGSSAASKTPSGVVDYRTFFGN